MRSFSLLLPLAFVGSCRPVTIYTTPSDLASSTANTEIPQSTGVSAYTQEVLVPPTPPTNLTQVYPITILPVDQVVGLSTVQKGSYVGFSVELSVVGQVCTQPQRAFFTPFVSSAC